MLIRLFFPLWPRPLSLPFAMLFWELLSKGAIMFSLLARGWGVNLLCVGFGRRQVSSTDNIVRGMVVKPVCFCAILSLIEPSQLWLSVMLSNSRGTLGLCHSYLIQNFTQCSRWGHTSTGQSGTVPSLTWLAVLGLVHSRRWFALWAARLHCWIMFNLPSVRTQILSVGLLTSLLSPMYAKIQGCPRCNIDYIKNCFNSMLVVLKSVGTVKG